jgi:hypothetical protein
MKNIFLALVFIFGLSLGLSAQNTPQNSSINSSGLTYSPQLPKEDSYKILKNDTGLAVPQEILMEINKHRKAEEDFTWVVNDKIEILIYTRKK